jgi:hypothetical protein
MEATLGFWRDMIGARVLFDMEIAGARNVMIAIGPGKLNIYDQPPREGRCGAFHHIGIQTDDLEALTEHMRGKGFRFQGRIREHGSLRYIMAMAPDDILVEIFQAVSENASPERRGSLKRAFAFDDTD